MIIFYFLSKTIQYKIIGENLFVCNSKIEIISIRKIYKTNNPLSSPALSLNRLAIIYNTFDEILISPKNCDNFIKELLKKIIKLKLKFSNKFKLIIYPIYLIPNENIK